MRPLRVWNVITNTCYGGAEIMLHKLMANLDRRDFDLKVVSLLERGVTGTKIEAAGVPVEPLHLVQRGVPRPAALLKLAGILRQDRPDVVQTWMYHADLCGGLAARLAGRIPVVWNVRHSTLDKRIDKLRTRMIARTCAQLSGRIPEQIVVNSRAGRRVHEALGYRPEKMQVIPNCFDLSGFQPCEQARHDVREELGLAGDAILIGLAGRFHEMKGHRYFVDAAAQLARQFDNCHFLLCGRGVEWSNAQLADWIDGQNLRPRFHVLGPRQDMPRIHAALDVAVSASVSGEGFSNVVGEAMACGVPCVVTDVGDSADIVAETGIVVPPWNSDELAQACAQRLGLDVARRRELGRQARRRIAEKYDIGSITERYASLWQGVAVGATAAPTAEMKAAA